MTVKKLFQNDVYIKEADAVITDIKDGTTPDTACLYLDRTPFFPEGGGQSCDIGQIGGFAVTDVQEDGADICHTVLIPADAPSSLPERGDTVHCVIDWDRRFDNMQRHCGEHILSGVFNREFGGVNRGFHMGEDYMTVDISLEHPAQNGKSYDNISWDDALHAERCANRVIWNDLPVSVHRFATRNEAEKMPLRKVLAFDEDISIVCVGDVAEPADCVACCGTHPSTSGQVGLIKLYKVEKNKGMFRIYFEAGKRALEDFDRKHDLLTDLGNTFSAGTDDLAVKIRKRLDKAEASHEKLIEMSKLAIGAKAAEIMDSPNHLFFIDPFSPDDAVRIGDRVMKDASKEFLALYVESQQALILFSSGKIDCGKAFRDAGLKGGGKPDMARGKATKQEAEEFISKLI